MTDWSRRISYKYLVPLALFLALAPFYPRPHLLEKVGMLLEGTLSKPIDIFDLFWHSWPIVLLLIKLVVDWRRRAQKRSSENQSLQN
jgi:hypothetical protein